VNRYVPAVGAGALLFVSGHDPERGGRLAYRGRVGAGVSAAGARAAARLATANALVSARAALGSLARVRRCVALTVFVDAAPGTLEPGVLGGALGLVASAVGGAPPAVWLRPARGLAGGMPVEVELLLETRRPGGGAPAPRAGARAALSRTARPRARRPAGAAGARAPRRPAGRAR
jgi:enamine deaminase RidA (YjgF/YER057c/UK114 family)